MQRTLAYHVSAPIIQPLRFIWDSSPLQDFCHQYDDCNLIAQPGIALQMQSGKLKRLPGNWGQLCLTKTEVCIAYYAIAQP